jgi:SAM-dependent methyltransferase
VVIRALACAALLACAGAAAAQDPGPVHDAPYLPSPPAVVHEMLRLAAVGPGDMVYDLGSGDGRVVIAAARDFGARGVGIEIDAALVARSRESAARHGVAERVRFVRGDIFKADLGEATVIALYLAPNFNLKLRPALLALRPGTRVVAHGADMGDWKPDRRTTIRKDVMLWIVPAKVAGRWRSAIGFGARERRLELEIVQRFQELSARAALEGAAAQVWEASLEADRLGFVIVDSPDTAEEAALYFEGRVRGERIEGTVARGAGPSRRVLPWKAERVARQGPGAPGAR